jgi:hypothetical protein
MVLREKGEGGILSTMVEGTIVRKVRIVSGSKYE